MSQLRNFEIDELMADFRRCYERDVRTLPNGITYLPRQEGGNGRIAKCEVYCSTDPASWGEPVAKATWPNTTVLQTVRFQQPVKARYVKVVARSEVNGRPYASIAELDVLTEGK